MNVWEGLSLLLTAQCMILTYEVFYVQGKYRKQKNIRNYKGKFFNSAVSNAQSNVHLTPGRHIYSNTNLAYVGSIQSDCNYCAKAGANRRERNCPSFKRATKGPGPRSSGSRVRRCNHCATATYTRGPIMKYM